MANSIAKLAILLTTDTSGMTRGFAQGMSETQQFANNVQSTISAISFAGLAGGAGFLGWGVKLAAEAEQASVAFRVMMGDAEKAKALLANIKDFALNSPFNQADLRESGKVLMQFGVDGENIMPVLRMLGDISLGNADKLRLLSLAFGQMSSAGRLTGQDLLQMINAGFNPLQEISKLTGESMAVLKKRMEDGKISAREVAEAFQSVTSEGGRFHGMMKEMSDTVSGRFAKLVEQTQELAVTFGEKLMPAMKSALQVGTQFLEWIGKVDMSTVKWTISIGAALIVFPKIYQGLKFLINIIRDLATAQAISQGLAGPKGWAILAGAAFATGVAVWGINEAFDAMSVEVNNAQKQLDKLAKDAEKTNKELEKTLNPKKFNGGSDPIEKMADGVSDLARRGEELAKNLRTPFEKISDDLKNAHSLFKSGLITAETWERAQGKARADLEAQAKSAERIRDSLTPQNMPALQYGSQEAIAYIANARNAQEAKEAKERAQVEALEKIEQWMQRAVQALEGDNQQLQVNEVAI